jgi:hypothetical protein
MSQHEAIWLGASGLVDICMKSERDASDQKLSSDIWMGKILQKILMSKIYK